MYLIVSLTGPPGTEEEEEEEEEDIPCCVRVNGLCEWVEPSCQAIDEEDRKRDIWDEFICDEIHPDDIKLFQERFDQFNRAKKLLKFEKVVVVYICSDHTFYINKIAYCFRKRKPQPVV